MLNLKNTLDGYLKNVEVIGNTVQDTNNLADIRSVGDKVEGQELYKISIACYGDNILRPDFELGLWNVSNGTAQVDSTAIRTKGFLRIRNQAHLVKRFDGKLGCQVILFDENFKYLGQQSYAGGSYVRYDNILPNARYMKINFLNTTDLNLKCILFDRVPSNINGVEFVEYHDDIIEIFSPVQLEKVGDVADRIICKDGVWGVEKHIGIFDDFLNCNLSVWPSQNTDTGVAFYVTSDLHNQNVMNIVSNKFLHDDPTRNRNNFVANSYNIYILRGRIPKDALSSENATSIKEYLHSIGAYVKYVVTNPQFIPLSHDQQVKLRIFAGQTNILFNTEIAGQIKAQVPKSLGATVNTHTEQISDLHNSLERVKKLGETTVSTVETERSFTTVDATSNGYFEGVRLEGKTLVNRFDVNTITYDQNLAGTVIKENNGYTITNVNESELFVKVGKLNIKPNKTYTLSLNIEPIVGDGKNDVFVYVDNKPIQLSGGASVGVKNFVFTSGENFTYLRLDVNGQNSIIKFKDIIILEGDYTQNPPSYFEGLKSVGDTTAEIVVESVKGDGNLFDGEVILNAKFENNGSIAQGDNAKGCVVGKNFIKVDSNFRYNLASNKNFRSYLVCEYDKYKNFICRKDSINENSLSQNCEYVKIYCYSNDTSLDLTNLQIMFTKGTTPKPYTTHQSDKKPLLYYNPTTETWEKPILREWDNIEKHSDGKYYYHKRSGEVVLNGSENWMVSGKVNNGVFKTTYSVFLQDINPLKPNINDSLLIPSNIQYIKNGYMDSVEGTYMSNNISTGSPIITYQVDLSKLSTQDVAGFKAWLKANPTTVVYQLAQEEVYECTNIDLMTYSGETNYIVNSGAISPKSLLKVHNNVSNVVKILQEKVSLLENTFIAGLKSVLSGDMYSLATILYPEDFEQNGNIEQDIMVIPE